MDVCVPPTAGWLARACTSLLGRATGKSGGSGFYEDTPDRMPILGLVDEVPVCVSAARFSGNGLRQAPAAGEVIAQVICGQPTSVDIAALRFDRFAQGALVTEPIVL